MSPAPSAAAGPLPATGTRQALVVDDNQLNRGLVSLYLKRLGWRTEAADSGPAALQRLGEGRYDLVLLDLRMPSMSGEEVCAGIRGNPALAALRVVAYTAHSTPEEKERILSSGFDGLLIKPISFADVREACGAA